MHFFHIFHFSWTKHSSEKFSKNSTFWIWNKCHPDDGNPPSAITHWGRVTHICVGKLIIVGSDNGLSLGWRQAIIWTDAGIWITGPLATNFNEILIAIETFSFRKMYLKMSSGKFQPFCLGLNVIIKVSYRISSCKDFKMLPDSIKST